MCYANLINGAAVFNIIRFVPQYGQTCNGLYRYLFAGGSLSVCSFGCFKSVNPFFLKKTKSRSTFSNMWAGNECKSTWNSTKADIFRNESVILSSNLGIHIGHTYRCDNPVELLDTFIMYITGALLYFIYGYEER